jgi:threonine dehydratase
MGIDTEQGNTDTGTRHAPETVPDIHSVNEASELIKDRIIHTPVLNDPGLDAELGCTLFLKCENLQRTGAFKFRGASNAIARLREQGLEGDVATESSGNHGAALALAASLDGRKAHISMPHNSVAAKIASVRRYGGTIHFCDPDHRSRAAGLARLVDAGYISVHPYEHPAIISGQGTTALEILSQVDHLDALLAPIGGGGLISGMSIVAASANVEIMGTEPEGAADAFASFESGTLVDSWQPDTIADGLRALIGESTFALIKRNVSRILLVSEEEIKQGMSLIWKHIRLPIEPSSATIIAAIKRYPEHFRNRRIGAVITGGNIDPQFWVDIINNDPDPENPAARAALHG